MSSGVIPVLDTTTILSASPQICPTAETSPAENSPWPISIARGLSPSEALLSLIVFLEVFADVARPRRVLHATDQPIVECFSRVYPRIAEQVVQRDDFGDHCDVLSGIEVDRDLGQLDFEYGRGLNVESCPF